MDSLSYCQNNFHFINPGLSKIDRLTSKRNYFNLISEKYVWILFLQPNIFFNRFFNQDVNGQIRFLFIEQNLVISPFSYQLSHIQSTQLIFIFHKFSIPLFSVDIFNFSIQYTPIQAVSYVPSTWSFHSLIFFCQIQDFSVKNISRGIMRNFSSLGVLKEDVQGPFCCSTMSSVRGDKKSGSLYADDKPRFGRFGLIKILKVIKQQMTVYIAKQKRTKCQVMQ